MKVCPECGREYGNSSVRCVICKCDLEELGERKSAQEKNESNRTKIREYRKGMEKERGIINKNEEENGNKDLNRSTMIKCPECGKSISNKAKACPGCGCPVGISTFNNNEILCYVEGVNGQLYLYANRVVIKRKGFFSKMAHGFFKGEKEIFLSQISGIQVRKGGLMINGYIQFTLSGGNESTKGIIEATQDENTVMFNRNQNYKVEELKKKIYEIKG